MYHPTTRVLAVLELLQTHGRMSGADMANRLGVDARTLRRYIVTLDEIGIPITTERGRHGGYALMPGFKLPPMMFTEDEALALGIGLLAARSLGFAEAATAVASAQAKLERIMPDTLKQRVRAVGDTVRLGALRAGGSAKHSSVKDGLAKDASTGDAAASDAPDSAALVTLSSAAVAQRRVHLRYQSADNALSERDFDPYGLAFWGGTWYTIGWCHLRGSMRSFRLDRILKAEARNAGFVRPAEFDALDYLRQSLASMGRQFAFEIFLATDLAEARRHFSSEVGVFAQEPGGVLLRGQTDHIEWCAHYLAGVPFDFEVRAPVELREAVARLGQRLLRLSASV